MRVLHYIPSMKAVAASAFLGYKLDLLCPNVNPNQAESGLNFMGWAV